MDLIVHQQINNLILYLWSSSSSSFSVWQNGGDWKHAESRLCAEICSGFLLWGKAESSIWCVSTDLCHICMLSSVVLCIRYTVRVYNTVAYSIIVGFPMEFFFIRYTILKDRFKQQLPSPLLFFFTHLSISLSGLPGEVIDVLSGGLGDCWG